MQCHNAWTDGRGDVMEACTAAGIPSWQTGCPTASIRLPYPVSAEMLQTKGWEQRPKFPDSGCKKYNVPEVQGLVLVYVGTMRVESSRVRHCTDIAALMALSLMLKIR